MPIYEYQCNSCQHRLEKLQKLSDPLLTLCPECNAFSLKKLVSAAAFRLKGSGWYETDFKTGSKRNIMGESGQSSDSGDSTSSSDSSSAKSDDKKATDKKASSDNKISKSENKSAVAGKG